MQFDPIHVDTGLEAAGGSSGVGGGVDYSVCPAEDCRS